MSRLTGTARRSAVALGVLVVVLAAAACGSSGGGSAATTSATAPNSATASATAVDPAFAARVDMQCALGNTYGRAHPFPFPKFNPLKPTVKDLPAIGAYFEKSPDVAGRIIALGTPATGQASWRQVVAALRAEQTNSAKQAAAATKSDAKAFVALVNAAGLDQKVLAQAATRAGLAGSKACVGYFGG